MRQFAAAAILVLLVAGCTSTGSSAPGSVSAVVLPSAESPYLPFDIPISEAPKVFAHYMPTFPVSIDNKPAEADYYTTEYLNPYGENGVHAAYGGYLRDRPLPRVPSPAANWIQRNLEVEVDQARSVGIDGFAVDVILPRSKSNVVDTILAAAVTRPKFSVMLTMDMNGPAATSQPVTAFVDDIVHYASSPAAYRLPDNRLVLSAFRAEARPATWWAQVLDMLAKRGVTVAFFPILLEANANLEKFAPVSYGLGSWGGRSPVAFSMSDPNRGAVPDLARRTRQMAVKYMQPVAFQDNRPYVGIYSEAKNSQTMRASWDAAVATRADMVEIMTWNDYAETTAVAPSMHHGYRVIDMMAYLIATYKTGARPQIKRDAVYATYRTQLHETRPTFPQTKLMTLVRDSSPAVNEMEITTFSKAPSTATVRIGSEVLHCSVPAGMGHCTFPLSTGAVSVEMSRDGRTVARAGGGPVVTASPRVQDLQYVAVGGLR